MRHAYLILAHDGWRQLERLVALLDDPDNDIYIHIDRKASGCPADGLRAAVRHSRVEILSKYRIYWGCYEMVEAELLLLEAARGVGYDYYHLLSGADLPLRSQAEIHAFFESHRGEEFVHFAADGVWEDNPEIVRRTRIYHPIQSLRRRFHQPALNRLCVWIDRALMTGQLCLGVNRMKRHPGLEIRYGSQWFSITDALAAYLLENQPLIRDVFHSTNCADELFVQTLVCNSDFRQRLHRPAGEGSMLSNRRYIDWSQSVNGSPAVLREKDFERLTDSGCLFARKFSMDVEPAFFERVCELSQ